jgi:hypothetical protein
VSLLVSLSSPHCSPGEYHTTLTTSPSNTATHLSPDSDTPPVFLVNAVNNAENHQENGFFVL